MSGGCRGRKRERTRKREKSERGKEREEREGGSSHCRPKRAQEGWSLVWGGLEGGVGALMWRALAVRKESGVSGVEQGLSPPAGLHSYT